MVNSTCTDCPSLPGFWESQLVQYGITEKVVLTSVVSTIVALALLGNFLTIGVVLKRKQRPLFGTCLISLAISDILYASGTSSYYISQFVHQSGSLWHLGNTMCRLIPFIQNMTIMANAFTLVMIAFDRYLALNKPVKGKWEPEVTACTILFLFVWAIAGGISSSALWNYKNYAVLILIPDPENPKVPIDAYRAHMCIADKEVNGKYYVLVFSFIFVPTTLVFIWLNTIIATEIWERRKAVQQNAASASAGNERRTSEMHRGAVRGVTKTTSVDGKFRNTESSEKTKTTNTAPSTSINQTSSARMNVKSGTRSRLKTPRETRHIRMFKVILCLIAVFLVCRLPNWVFLLYKLHSTLTGHKWWMLQYSLGILALCNCMLNPLMYTFLGETLKFSEWLHAIFSRCLGKCSCSDKTLDRNKDNEAFPTEQDCRKASSS